MRISDFKANSSNNTVFADDKGNIAVLSPQFMPRRDNRFDYTKPVDGSDPATDWHGLHAVAELPNTIDPPTGWAFNSNDWLYSAAGPYSPEACAISRAISTWPARAIARSTRPRLLTQPGRGASIGCRPPPTTAPSRRSKCWCRCWFRPGRRLPATDPRRASSRRADRRAGELGQALVGQRRCPTRSRNSGAMSWRRRRLRAEWDDHDNMFRHMERLTPAEKLDTFDARLRPAPARFRQAGACRGARSTAFSASRRDRVAASTTRRRASRSASPPINGARSPRSVHRKSRARSDGTGPTATASSRWSNSGSGSAPGP